MRNAITGLLLLLSLAEAKEIVMGIVPQQSPLKLIKVWEPVARYLSEATGEKVVFKTEKSIQVFEEVLYQGGYDFAYMNPYHFVIAEDRGHYEAKIRAKKNLTGILVGSIKSDLAAILKRDPVYLFPSPNAFAATMLVQYELQEQFHCSFANAEKVRFVNSHDSVYKGVARGVGDLGGGIIRTFDNLNDPATKQKLKILFKTKSYPSHPFAFRTDMDRAVQDKLVEALLNMPEALKKALEVKSFIRIDNAEYAPVRQLVKKLNIGEK